MKKIIIFLVVCCIMLVACSPMNNSSQQTKQLKETVGNKKSEKKEQERVKAPSYPYAMSKHKEEANLVQYTGDIHHVFYHSIINDAELGFSGVDGRGYYDWMVTATEFKRSLDELFKRNYILIDPHEAFDLTNTPITKKKLMLPKNKIPLILSIDDMNYYDYMKGRGFAKRLVLDEAENVIAEYVNRDNTVITSREHAIVPILDDFVLAHPDFSYKGNKGVIALTGFEGILGYRTNDTASSTYKNDVADVKDVVAALKRDGWVFASHSYGHINFMESSYQDIVQDSIAWQAEVEPLVGHTDLFIYPFGARVIAGSEAFEYLTNQQRFKYLAAVGPTSYLEVNPQAVMQDRVAIDGMNLFNYPEKLVPYLNRANVYNEEERKWYIGPKGL